MFWQTLLQMLADAVAQFLLTAIQAPDDARRGGNAPGHIVLSTRTDPARGYLPADGGTHPTEDYPDLSHAQGTGGDTDFDVPDTAGRQVVLEDVEAGLLAGMTGGGTEGSGTADLPAHSHGLADHTHDITQTRVYIRLATDSSGFAEQTVSVGGAISDGAHSFVYSFLIPSADHTQGPDPADTEDSAAAPGAIDLSGAVSEAAYVVMRAEVKT